MTMMLLRSLFLLLTWAASSYGCASHDHPDKMHSLPGLNMPLPSPWYSGYLHYELEGQQVHTHYVLVDAEDDDEGEGEGTKPLIYWTNGGPGASSLFGLLTELGPLILSDLSLGTPDYKATGIPTPLYNPHSWTRLGSVLIIDQPAPVGFSYCNDDMESHSCGGIAWTDELASLNAYLAMQAFYETHPCYHSKDLYLTGESYAGIYVPTLARRIVEGNASIPLKGFGTLRCVWNIQYGWISF
jgi:carboxypeptidase C (cathepsin A)